MTPAERLRRRVVHGGEALIQQISRFEQVVVRRTVLAEGWIGAANGASLGFDSTRTTETVTSSGASGVSSSTSITGSGYNTGLAPA